MGSGVIVATGESSPTRLWADKRGKTLITSTLPSGSPLSWDTQCLSYTCRDLHLRPRNPRE